MEILLKINVATVTPPKNCKHFTELTLLLRGKQQLRLFKIVLFRIFEHSELVSKKALPDSQYVPILAVTHFDEQIIYV